MTNRRSYIWDHLKGVFEIENLVDINAKTNNPQARILLDGYNSKENISGQYFAGIEMNLTPEIPAGYLFDKWLVTDNESTKEYNTQTLTIVPTQSLEITLVTKEAQPIEICEIKSSEELEFVELYNNSEYNFDISGYSITGNINCQFAQGTIIPANGYIVVSNQAIQSSINES